jgi:hypothetical protein
MIKFNSKLVTALAVVPLLAGAVTLATAGVASADPVNGAYIANDFGCGLGDGNGVLVFTDTSHSVINVSNSVTKCAATVTPSATGKAVVVSGFGCGVELRDGTFVTTDDSRETVSASGQATLTCKASS